VATKQKKGKWAHLVGKLPRLNNIEPTRQEKLNIIKEETIKEHREKHGIPPTAAILADEYFTLKETKKLLEEQMKDIDLELEAITQLLENQYEAEGVSFLRLTDGGSVGMHYEPYAVVTDRDKNRQWAVENGYERLLSLPWQTINSELKARLERGEPEPDGVEAFLITKFTKRG
jgi:hypothetical protein